MRLVTSDGSGNDILLGGDGRDLLIGGFGADRLVGNQDDDILIAGTTSHDAHEVALLMIMQKWTSAASYADRIAHLQAGTGLSAGYRLDGNDGVTQTVFNDDDVDTLTGSQGRDWFLGNLDGASGEVLDLFFDTAANETGSDIDA
jgi:Ca2+-binding RTX toxin-like protein